MNDSVELTGAKAQALGWILRLIERNEAVDLKRFPDHVLAAIAWDVKRDRPTAAGRIIGTALYRHHLGIEPERRLIEDPQMVHEAIQVLCIACAMERLRRRGLLEDWEMPDVFEWHLDGSFTWSEDAYAKIKELFGRTS